MTASRRGDITTDTSGVSWTVGCAALSVVTEFVKWVLLGNYKRKCLMWRSNFLWMVSPRDRSRQCWSVSHWGQLGVFRTNSACFGLEGVDRECALRSHPLRFGEGVEVCADTADTATVTRRLHAAERDDCFVADGLIVDVYEAGGDLLSEFESAHGVGGQNAQ